MNPRIKKTIETGLLLAVLSSGAMAQNPENKISANKQNAPAMTIPLCTGTAINAVLVGALDSQRSKPGDPVTAIVTESVVYQRSVLLPKGTRIQGRVVRTGAEGEETSALFVEFDRAILKTGQEAQLNAGIQALAAVGTPATIPSREKYEENRMDGPLPVAPGLNTPESQVLPSTYTVPRRLVSGQAPSSLEGGLDRKGMFTPDSKGAFSDSSVRVFTPVSEGSHGTVLVGTKQAIHLENGTRLLIVVQPPASARASAP